MQRGSIMADQYYNVGKIVNTQGIKGEVRVIATTDFVEDRFQAGKKVFLFADNAKQPLELVVRSHRAHKQFQILAFEGYQTINDVEKFKGAVLKITAEDRHDLPSGEFYFDQIIGLEVWTEEGERIGTVKEILQPGANDVWVVEREKQADLLLPYIDSCIKQVDLAEKKVIVHLLEGLE